MKQPFELDKAYSPAKYEAKIYQQWEDSGAFRPEGNKAIQKPGMEPFSIIMPPPNANGDLHAGHAMFVVEDIMTRYRRMQGHPTLWLPGTDHAGIETQVVFERKLAAEGKSRFDFTPTEFYDAVMKYTRANQHNIIGQLRSLGFSADWSRLKFTLHDDIINSVYDTFIQMHKDGLVYRANRIVNWCPRCNAAFADIEIKHRDQIDPLYYIKYGPFVLATVRPETKFGDTAIAVNPHDERYAQYVGKEIEAQSVLGHKFKIQVIADDHVDPAFGTGAVKVTPAHDPNDWEMGLRHKLPVVPVIGTDGRLLPIAGKYAGLLAGDARTAVAADMEAKGLMDHIDLNYSHSVAYHDRCGTLIEPLVTEQWWLSVDQLKTAAIKAVKSGEIKIVPARFEKVYIDWLENLRDWNISRQIWWGIRIPVYYRAGSPAAGDTDTSPGTHDADTKQPYLIAKSEAEAKAYYGEGNYEAETDTFDTWFSSSQWPFATLGYPDSPDFKQFYPTTVMETGRDILFQWVSRMVMLGIYRTGQVPFKNIYLHGLVNDAHGKKMSKSKGNVLNPLVMTDKYGTDALRLALTIGITPGNDGSLSEAKIEGYRNFANKLWNVARFILGSLPENYSPAAPVAKSPADAWLLTKLDTAITGVTQAIEDYRFSEAGQMVYSLLWDDFADWYIEASKVSPNHDLLLHGLRIILGLLHPIAPFVTEAIWSHYPQVSSLLITEAWPVVDTTRTKTDLSGSSQFTAIQSVVQATRTIVAEEQLNKPVILTTDKALAANADLVTRLARAGAVRLVEQGSGLYLGTAAPAWIEASPEQVATRRHRLEQQQADKQTFLKSLQGRLANDSYVKNAPEAVVQETRDRLTETQNLLDRLGEQLAALGR